MLASRVIQVMYSQACFLNSEITANRQAATGYRNRHRMASTYRNADEQVPVLSGTGRYDMHNYNHFCSD